MKVLKQILDFYINTSIHVAIAVFSLVQITKLSLNITTNSNLDFLIFFGTILGYNFLKYLEVFLNRIFTFDKNYSIIVISFIAFLGMIYFYFRLESNVQIEILKIGFLVLVYPFIRKFAFLKMAFVSFCLTLVTVFILQINQNYIYLVQRFLIIFCFLIPLEICDLNSDSKTIETLPQIIGIQNLKILGYFLLVIFCCLNFYLLKFIFYIDFVIAIITAISIFFSNYKCSKYYTSFWVESLPIFWWILIYIFIEIL